MLSPVESITSIRKILGIPNFYIKRFEFDNFDKDNMAFLQIDNNIKIDSSGISNSVYYIKLKLDTLFYQRNVFFGSYDTQIDNQLNMKFWESTIEQKAHEYKDNISSIYERSLEFNRWLKASYNIDNFGIFDNMLHHNKNKKVQEYLTSYSNTLLKACFSLFINESLPLFRNVFNEGVGSNENYAFPCFNNYNFYMYNVGYVINSKSERFIFYIKYERRKMYMILEDNISKIRYQFERIYDGGPDWEPVKFKIIDFENQELFISKAGNSNEVILNNMNIETKQSLAAIYKSFN